MEALITGINRPFLDHIVALLPGDLPIYLVGGAIRDALLNRSNYDYDFVTPGDALKIARQLADDLGAAFFPLDTRRNVARLIIKPSGQFSTPLDRPIRVDFSKCQGPDLNSDLQGRDFTINAMAMDMRKMQIIIDPLHGASDLVSKCLRVCSEFAFINDPVRILRAVRFSVDLGMTIQPETLRLIRQSVAYLPDVSGERLRDELFRILMQARPNIPLRLLDKLSAFEYILPEITELKGIEQSAPHVMNAWDHTLDLITRLENIFDVLAPEFDADKAGNFALGSVALWLGRYRQNLAEHLHNAINPDRPHRSLIFLSGLFHDVGKVQSRSVDDRGKIRFIEHEQIGSQLVKKRSQALKLSNLEIDRLVAIIKHHMRPSLLSHPTGLPGRKTIYRFFRDTGVAGVDICILSLADLLATYGSTLPQDRWLRHLDVVRSLLAAWWEDETGKLFPTPFLNGDELMELLDLSPGPFIGYVLEEIREAQVAGDIHSKEEAIFLARGLSKEYVNKKTG